VSFEEDLVLEKISGAGVSAIVLETFKALKLTKNQTRQLWVITGNGPHLLFTSTSLDYAPLKSVFS
jgi:hypothetical protein